MILTLPTPKEAAQWAGENAYKPADKRARAKRGREWLVVKQDGQAIVGRVLETKRGFVKVRTKRDGTHKIRRAEIMGIWERKPKTDAPDLCGLDLVREQMGVI